MSSLLLLRHAKSSWKDLNLKDFDRPLNSRGRNDAKKIGKRLLLLNLIPDIIISSSSLRTEETVNILKLVIGKDISTHFTSNLYHASHNIILQHFFDLYTLHNSVMIVGHNPGIQFLFENLSETNIQNYPTCSFSFFRYSQQKKFNLLNFESPKRILLD